MSKEDENCEHGSRPQTIIEPTKLPRWAIIIITFFLVVVAIGILVAGVFNPWRFQTTVAKFFVCFLLAFCLSVVLFGIYPQMARLKFIPLINLPVELVGPASLFIISILFLWKLYPEPPGRFYRLNIQGATPQMLLETLRIEATKGRCEFYPACKSPDGKFLEGIYVEFVGEDKQCKAKIGSTTETYLAVFDRTASENIIELKQL